MEGTLGPQKQPDDQLAEQWATTLNETSGHTLCQNAVPSQGRPVGVLAPGRPPGAGDRLYL